VTYHTRRHFLRLAGLYAAALHSAPALARGVGRRPLQDPAEPDLELRLEAVVEQASLRSGPATEVWRYRATVVAGDPSAVVDLPGAFPGPLIRVRRGWVLRVHFVNRLPERTTVHWHGLNVPEAADGHPRFAVDPGAAYTYEFTVLNDPGPYWFHPHPDMRTGLQTYMGQAGLLWVEEAMPTGLTDLPLVLQDRTLTADNRLLYRQDMMGMLGDEIWVNGRADAAVDVPPARHRLRILNGSNSRIYKLAWQAGLPLTVLGSDGGALSTPVQRPYAMLAPGQRLDILADFADPGLGRRPVLESLAFSGASLMDAGTSALPLGVRFPLVAFRVAGDAPPPLYLPAVVKGEVLGRPVAGHDRPSRAHPLGPAQDRSPDRRFELRAMMGGWTINGRSFELEGVAEDEIVRLGADEVWEFANQGAGMGGMGRMAMAHAMHLHLVQFQVVGRDPDPRFAADYATVSAGLIDDGWLDTVLVMPFERVRIRATFRDFPGLYLYHCHMLEHEDMGMMRNFRVVP
jgi:FtsP/CotA-like multicopper oxidase with cupredoxin domain